MPVCGILLKSPFPHAIHRPTSSDLMSAVGIASFPACSLYEVTRHASATLIVGRMGWTSAGSCLYQHAASDGGSTSGGGTEEGGSFHAGSVDAGLPPPLIPIPPGTTLEPPAPPTPMAPPVPLFGFVKPTFAEVGSVSTLPPHATPIRRAMHPSARFIVVRSPASS
jgi:hypothetical protein